MHVGKLTITSAEVVDAMPHLDKAPTFWQIHHSGLPSQYFSIYGCICGRVLLFFQMSSKSMTRRLLLQKK